MTRAQHPPQPPPGREASRARSEEEGVLMQTGRCAQSATSYRAGRSGRSLGAVPLEARRFAGRAVQCWCGLALWLAAPRAGAQTSGETRFFRDCPASEAVRLHDEASPWDLHAVLYTAVSVGELEVLRLADWVVDLSVPGASVNPFHGSVQAIRRGYHGLPPWRIVRRAGELADALQLPELSLGDAAATYSAATGGAKGPGSGLIVRIQKLVDWMQHVTGDINELGGRVMGRPRGLVTWSLPGRMVDGLQWLLVKAFNHTGVLAGRLADGAITGVELVGEGLAAVGRRRPHRKRTVFLLLPIEVYRAHELWMLQHRSRLTLGEPELFAESTHATLTHHRRGGAPVDWSVVDRLQDAGSVVIVMLDVRLMSRLPEPLRSYVVPAAWVLNPASGQPMRGPLRVER